MFNSRASAPACSMTRENVSHDSADVPLSDPNLWNGDSALHATEMLGVFLRPHRVLGGCWEVSEGARPLLIERIHVVNASLGRERDLFLEERRKHERRGPTVFKPLDGVEMRPSGVAP